MSQPQSWIEGRFEENVMVTTVEQAINFNAADAFTKTSRTTPYSRA